MIDANKLEELKNSAYIVRNELETLIINPSDFKDDRLAQAKAVFTVCDTVVAIVYDYLTGSEEYGDRNLALDLLGMHYLLRSVRNYNTSYYALILACCDNNDEVMKCFWNMVLLLNPKSIEEMGLKVNHGHTL